MKNNTSALKAAHIRPLQDGIVVAIIFFSIAHLTRKLASTSFSGFFPFIVSLLAGTIVYGLRHTAMRAETKREKSVDVMLANEELFHTMSNAAPSMIWMSGPDKKCTYFNKSWLGFRGRTLEQEQGEGWIEGVHPDDLSFCLRVYNNAFDARENFNMEYRLKRFDGVYRWILNQGTPRFEGDGNFAGYIGSCIDISSRHEIEEALRESERKHSALLSNLGGMAYRCRNDQSRTMELVTEGCYELTGYSVSELQENAKVAFGDLIHPDDRQWLWEKYQSALSARQSFKNEYRIVTASGKVRWVWDQGTGIYSDFGELLKVEGFVTDITDRKLLEEQFRQAQKMESIGRLAGGIAHDFNNLLMVIAGYSDFLLNDLDKSDEKYQYAEEIHHACERGTNLTKQLLTFSRSHIVQPKLINLTETVLHAQKMLKRLIGENIEMITLPEANLGMVKIDASQMEQVLVNLVVNARDAMPSGGKLTVKTANVSFDAGQSDDRAGDYVMLSVRDTGTGMSDEVKKHLFEPFFTTKERGKGTGLGLATCYRIVKEIGGYIDVESEINRGTAVKIFLPRTSERSRQEKQKSEGAVSQAGVSETILVVEDESAVRGLAVKILASLGYKTLEAGNGKDALQLVGEHKHDKIHLLLTDVVMPSMNGKELAVRVKKLQPGIKILFMSGYTDQAFRGEDRIQFIQKPFTQESLALKVREALK